MAFTLVGYYENVDTAGVLTQLNALSDQHITFDNKDILVPDWASNIIQAIPIGNNITQSRLSAPSLRQRSELDLYPNGITTSGTVITGLMNRHERPVALTPGEGLRFSVAEKDAGAVDCIGLVWMEGERTPAPNGEVETIKATSSTTTTQFVWTLCKLDLSQQLRAGKYAIVGLRVQSASVIAARLVIPGSAYRPGVLGVRNVYQIRDDVTSNMRLGNWGEFEHTFVPQLEVLTGTTDTSQTVYLDIVKIS